MNDKDIFIIGNQIILRPLRESDIDGDYKFWLNDPDVVKYNSHGRFPKSESDLVSYIKTFNSNNLIVLAIIEKNSLKHIGNISLQNINWIDRNAEIAFLLGAKDFWGKGIMFEAGNILIKHAFNTLNLHRIYCGTSSKNIGMQKLASKLGMFQEGIKRESLFKDGEYLDIFEYAILNKK